MKAKPRTRDLTGRRKAEETIKQSIDKLEKDMSFIKDELFGLRKALVKFVTYLESQADIPDSFVESLSPNQLTKSGISMLEESGLTEIVNTHKGHFISLIKAKNPLTDYDMEKLCYDVLVLRKDKDYMNAAKEYAFNKGLDLMNMLYAASIYLRDSIIRSL